MSSVTAKQPEFKNSTQSSKELDANDPCLVMHKVLRRLLQTTQIRKGIWQLCQSEMST